MKNNLDVLFIYSLPLNPKYNADTIVDYINSIRSMDYSMHEINTAQIYRHSKFKISYDVIILHYSLFGTIEYLLDPFLIKFLRNAKSFKIAIFQDEQDAMNNRLKFINEIGIDVILSCILDESGKDIYYTNTSVKSVYTVLTGYVSEGLIEAANKKFEKEDRIFYRVRKFDFGNAALEKYYIGEFFLQNYDGDNLLDISSKDIDRLYCDNYRLHLSKAKFSLGAEAGTDKIVFEPNYVKTKLDYAQFLKGDHTLHEENYNLRVISPRIFENIAYGVVNVLYEGNYNGIIEPMKHYIPLKKDHSNFEEVKMQMRDSILLSNIINNAKIDIIFSGKYDYEYLIKQIYEIISEIKEFNRFNYFNNFILYFFDALKYYAFSISKNVIRIVRKGISKSLRENWYIYFR